MTKFQDEIISDRTDVLCAMCQIDITNYPPAPEEPNIDIYKKALELACFYSKQIRPVFIPEYFIEQVQEGKKNDK